MSEQERLPTAGWYDDPEGSGERYWDGQQWTEETRSGRPAGGQQTSRARQLVEQGTERSRGGTMVQTATRPEAGTEQTARSEQAATTYPERTATTHPEQTTDTEQTTNTEQTIDTKQTIDDQEVLPAAGWYDDPGGSGERYWDGQQWTDQVRDVGEPATEPTEAATEPAEPADDDDQRGWTDRVIGLARKGVDRAREATHRATEAEQAEQAGAAAEGGDQLPAAGWYDDPSGTGERYWDGQQWTQQTREAQAAGAAARRASSAEGRAGGTGWADHVIEQAREGMSHARGEGGASPDDGQTDTELHDRQAGAESDGEQAEAAGGQDPLAVAATGDEAEQIRKFAGLRDEGLLSEQEFQAKKKQILGL